MKGQVGMYPICPDGRLLIDVTIDPYSPVVTHFRQSYGTLSTF